MLIIGQDRTLILNLDNVNAIATNNNEDNKKICCKCNNNDLCIIGEYETEERTKQVLQEIIDNIGVVKEYYMPEK